MTATAANKEMALIRRTFFIFTKRHLLYIKVSGNPKNMKYLTILIMISGSLFCYGQNKALKKREELITKIIGNWTFSDGYVKGDKSVEIDSNPILDSITFNPDMTFKYSCEYKERGKLKVTGIWDIDSNGTTIKFMNRVASPTVPGAALDFNRKFKLIGSTKLRIEEEFELVPHPNPDQQVGKAGREIMILNYTKTE